MTFELADDQPDGKVHAIIVFRTSVPATCGHQMMSTGNRQPGVVAVERG